MNITKTLCLCAALSGAAGIQAMENCELVTKQDNTRVNTYQTNRPEVSACSYRRKWSNKLPASSNY